MLFVNIERVQDVSSYNYVSIRSLFNSIAPYDLNKNFF